MGTRTRVGCLVILSFCETAAAEPRRQSFTGDLGLGFALTSVPVHTVRASSENTNPTRGADLIYEQHRETKAGLAPLSVSLGGFATPNVALLFRISGTSYFVDGEQFGHNFYGLIVELWPHDRFYASAGAGVALFGPNPFLSGSDEKPEGGWALDFRVGVALINAENHDLTLSVEAIPGFYDGDSVQGYAFVPAWKWY